MPGCSPRTFWCSSPCKRTTRNDRRGNHGGDDDDDNDDDDDDDDDDADDVKGGSEVETAAPQPPLVPRCRRFF